MTQLDVRALGLVGAFAVGAVPPGVYVVGLAGFCGGYTTFSTVSLDAVRLVRRGQVVRAAGYALGTLAGTVAVAALGAAAAAWVLA